MKSALPLVRLPANATVHRFGTPTPPPPATVLLRFPQQGWTIDKPGESSQSQGWAIVGDAAGRKLAVETLLSRHRIHPSTPPPGPFPYIASLLTPSPSDSSSLSGTPSKPVRHLAFARPPTTGEFTDFTARYGALQEEDKLSFRETLSALNPPPLTDEIERVAKTMRIDHLLDLPSVSLSSGQTRRARIASALLTRPVLLLLEDPMAGLDIPSRAEVSRILGDLNGGKDMKVVLVLRAKAADSVPEWVTDICEVQDGQVWIGTREEWQARAKAIPESTLEEIQSEQENAATAEAGPVVALDSVSISYGEGSRPVLKEVSWNIKPGEKWHLQGANGSGKTTLLSLILGHHPRSFSLPASSLTLFSKPRRETPTPVLRSKIGHTSPEIFAAFPRGMGLTAFQSIGTGFEGVFSRRQVDAAQKERILRLIEFFKVELSSARLSAEEGVIDVAKKQFAHFTPPQQSLLLFLRAVVSRPPLLILDEPSQGVDEAIWSRCRVLLEQEWKENPDQAVIVVSHYDDEVPWRRSRGRVLRLVDGVASLS